MHLELVGVGMSPAAVRGAWLRQGLALKTQRLLWPGQQAASEVSVLTERQIRLLQIPRGRLADPEQHIEALRRGYLLCQDTYSIGGDDPHYPGEYARGSSHCGTLPQA